MSETNFYETLLSVLRTDKRFLSEGGTFLRNAVYEAAMKMDENLIKLLLSNKDTCSRFFTNVAGVKVFDKVLFAWIINNRQFLPDSYTRFKNKIGLADEKGDLISSSENVELVFPYKDCVLEGGQTKEDQKRDEIFYNETLAPDEIDRLLYPKVLINAKRYTNNGTEDAIEFRDNDNLFIRGNNLLALSSLLKNKKVNGNVKCIYIDPPYFFSKKKEEDTFKYNSNFKLSSWLVFMKNRLEIARELLSDEGAIFVQISDDGVGELHCLLKDIFKSENFINKITVKTKSPSGFASVNPGVFETAEYILAFAKNKPKWKYNIQYVESGYDENYKFVVVNRNDPPETWIIKNIVDVLVEEQGYKDAKDMRKQLGKHIVNEMIAKYAFEHADSVFQSVAIGDNAGQNVVAMREASKREPEKIFVVPREGQYTVYIRNGREVAFYSKKLHEVDGKFVPSMQVSNIWMDTPYEGIAGEGSVTLNGGKKPEKLIRRILEMATNPGDLILDYHLGSGTTCAVAHKIGRKYIGIEQLDYGENDSTIRLDGVIKGDTTGISKAVKWQGGGSFVYCELAKQNQTIVEEIEAAKDKASLSIIYNKMIQSGFISHKINPKEIASAAEDFSDLSLDDQKTFLMEILDKNLLYVNYCDIDDTEFAISEEDKAFTRSFYGEK